MKVGHPWGFPEAEENWKRNSVLEAQPSGISSCTRVTDAERLRRGHDFDDWLVGHLYQECGFRHDRKVHKLHNPIEQITTYWQYEVEPEEEKETFQTEDDKPLDPSRIPWKYMYAKATIPGHVMKAWREGRISESDVVNGRWNRIKFQTARYEKEWDVCGPRFE